MNAQNLTQGNLKEIDEYFKNLKIENKDLKWEFMPNQKVHEPETYLEKKIESLESKIDELTNKINLIFGKNVLIQGKFVDLNL